MQIQRVVLSLALFLSLPLFARENIDIIIMRNGDRMTGQVKGLDDGVLSVSLPYVVQTLSVDWSKVARITSNQLFIVKTENGSVYRGTLNTAEEEGGKPVKIEIVETPAKQSAIEQAQIVQIAETSNKFWHQFNGAVNFGFTYTKGNETVQYTLASATEYLRERWSAEAKWSSAFSTSSGVTASKRNEITATCQHLLPWNNYFYAGLSDFLQSSVQGIQLQTSVGGGIGRYLKNTNRATISLLGGFAWQNTQYKRATFPAGTQNLAAALVLGEVKLFKFNMNAAYYIKIIGNLSWNMSFYGNWDNQPPPHFQGSDYGTSSGLSWTFGMKRDVRTGLAGINF